MKRAYIFVLREKQREIEPAVQAHVARFNAQQTDGSESWAEGSFEALQIALTNEFGVAIHEDHYYESLDPTYLSGAFAEQLLAMHPPSDMMPKYKPLSQSDALDYVKILMTAAIFLRLKHNGVEGDISGSIDENLGGILDLLFENDEVSDQFVDELGLVRNKAHKEYPQDADVIEEAVDHLEGLLHMAWQRA